jgi:hypothetical protein
MTISQGALLTASAIGALMLFGLGRSGANQQTFQQRRATQSAQAEARGLAEPFKGITTDGTVRTGLFTLRPTGVTTAPVQVAAQRFLGLLNADQRSRTVFPVDDPEWRKWMNQHFYVRQGISFAEMSEGQREGALALLRDSLSAKGLKLSRDIMRLNHTLGELNGNNFEEYGEWLYHLTIMGQPSTTEPWGWQLDGHHLIINYFVLGDQVVATPMFVGSEPVTATAGKYKGTSILQQEQAAGLAMVNALSADQRKQAILETSKAGNDNLTEAFKDNVVLDYAGVAASGLSSGQREQLSDLIQLFVDNIREDQARVRMSEVRQHLDQTHFAWIGPTADDAAFYFRIHSPVILIEFDHQRPANLRHLAADPQRPTREHIHVVVRTPNGNDYGKDLLRQHYAQHRHD